MFRVYSASFDYLNEWFNMFHGRPFCPVNWNYYGLR